MGARLTVFSELAICGYPPADFLEKPSFLARCRSAVDELAEATHAGTGLLPAMALTRAAGDELEALVADDLWPLATYQEMLFIL